MFKYRVQMVKLVLWVCIASGLLLGLAGISACETEEGEDDGGVTDEPISPTPQKDTDEDGVADEDDCQPNSADVYPGAAESCDGVDEDCDGKVDDIEYTVLYTQDVDGDSYGGMSSASYWYLPECNAPAGYGVPIDCNDAQVWVFPGAPELLNMIDDDCDGQIDDGTVWADADNDGYAEAQGGLYPGGDCDDFNTWTHPRGWEFCDGKDNDCDGFEDEEMTSTDTYEEDFDGDGYSVRGLFNPEELGTCNPEVSLGDCYDDAANLNPASTDVWDGIDQDCDGVADR